MEELSIDINGFLYYGDFKLPFKLNVDTGCFEFFDKDRYRSIQRGTRIVEVPARTFNQVNVIPVHDNTERYVVMLTEKG